MKKIDVLIIGAGPAGTIAAGYLKKQGLDVLIVEKQEFPRFVIGESLLPRCMDHLEEVGYLEAVKTAGFQEKLGATFFENGKKCEFLFAEQFTKGWEWTWQVPRSDFDNILANETQKKGVEILFNHSVEAIDFQEDKQIVDVVDSNAIRIQFESKYVIDASGYGRVIPRLLDLNKPSDLLARSSIFAHVDNNFISDKQRQNNIFIDTLDNEKSWMWIIPFLNGKTSVGVVGVDAKIVDLGENDAKGFKKLLAENEIFKNIFKTTDFDFEPKTIRGYSVGIKKTYGNGFVLCGNSTEFLDPVFSSGVTLAMESGMLAAKLVAKTLKKQKVDWQTEYEDFLMHGVDVFRSYVDAWYDGTLHTIFFTDEIRQDMKEQICSVLAGYVWDDKNPFVKKHQRALKNLAKVIKMT